MSGGVGGGGGFAGVGTLAARPAAGTRGRTYYATDTAVFYLDDGASWDAVGPALTTTYRGRSGLLPRRTGNTTLTLAPGRARSSNAAADIILAASASIDITTGGDGGFDVVTLSAAATTHGTTAFETTSNAIPNYAPNRAGLGTITTVGTALTLAGSSFTQPDTEDQLGPVAIGDLVGNYSKGFARLKSLDSATTATLEVALPNGDATAETWSIFERPTVALAAVSTDRRELKSIGGNGVTLTDCVVMGAALTSNAASVDLKLGGLADAVLRPYYTWVAVRTDGLVVKFCSTERTTPKIATLVGALSGSRRLASFWVDTGNAILSMTWSETSPTLVHARHEVAATGAAYQRVINGVDSGNAWTRKVAPLPPTSRRFYATAQTTAANDYVRFREASIGEAAVTRAIIAAKETGANVTGGSPLILATDAAQAIDFVNDNGGSVYLDLFAYEETL